MAVLLLVGWVSEKIGGALWVAFFASAAVFALGQWYYFREHPDVKLRRKVWRWALIGYAGGMLLLFLLMMGVGAFIFAPFLALLAYLSIRHTYICEACGKMSYNDAWLTKMERCPKCDARFEDD